MGKILLAGKEAHERPALLRDVIADRPSQHRVTPFERIEDGALGDRTRDLELHFTVDFGQFLEVKRKRDADHVVRKIPIFKTQAPNKSQIPKTKSSSLAGVEPLGIG